LGWAVDVLAPHAPGSSMVETMGGVRIERFRYLWPAWTQTVCYGGGALVNLERNPGNLLKLPFLIAAELFAVFRRLRRRRYALVHSHWILPQGFTAAIAARLLGVPHVLTVHGSDVLSLKGKALRPFKRAALRGADIVSVNSSATQHEVDLLGVSSVPVERIPMGVQEPALGKEGRRHVEEFRLRHRISEGPLLLFVGRLAEEKGWKDLINAMAILRDAGSDATLLMIGDGPDRQDALKLVDRLGVGERVTLAGWVEHGEIAAYLEAADIFVAPSCTTASGRSEAQGLALAEAMMSGRPVLTTRVGGIGDFVKHGQTGWLVAERSPQELASAVGQLHADRELAARLGAAAQLYASRHLSRRQTAEAFAQLYSRLVSRENNRESYAGQHGRNATADEKEARTSNVAGDSTGQAFRVLVLRHRSDRLAAYGGPVYTESVMHLLAEGPMQAALQELSFEGQPSRPVHLLRNLSAMMRAVVSPMPAKVLRFRSAGFERRLKALLELDRFDLVLVSGLEMLWCRPLIRHRAPLLYLCHNLEADLYRRQVSRLPRWLPFVRRDADKLEAFEHREIKRVDAVIAISPHDQEVLSRLAPGIPMSNVPPSFSYEPWKGGQDAVSDAGKLPIRLGFLGNFSWWPNRSAVDWFLTRVWPEAPEHFELHLFGCGSENMAKAPRVVGHGFIDELSDVWKQVQIMIQPVVVAAGLNIKVAEAVYNRRPMIATQAAIGGFGFDPDPAIVIVDTAEEWISYLRGKGPGELLRRQVSPGNANRFDKTRNADRLARFTGPMFDGFGLRQKGLQNE